ncbi:MAG TPA: DinB family protein [Vicinamibacteria bacterium]|nr:DinB family protein [Vicinamibacteria bacterium]
MAEGDVASFLIEDTRRRLAGLAEQVRTCLAALSDAELWERAHEKSNSVGNLVLHLCGSTRHFLGRGVGGSDYQRDRPAEFAEKGPIARAELLLTLDDTLAESDRVLARLPAERVMEAKDLGGRSHTVAELLVRVAHHWSLHTGQIVFDVKARKPGTFDELWMKTMEKR